MHHETKYLHHQGLKIAYDDSEAGEKTLLLLHGLTANKQNFDGLSRAGLAKNYRLIRPDLRGRGLSDKPETGYRMQDHAEDLLALIETLGLSNICLIGHSFGGLIAVYLAAHYPSHFSELVLLDVGIDATYPAVLERVGASLRFLHKRIKSWDLYMRLIQKSAFFADGYWDEDLTNFYRADVEILADGQIKPRAHAIGMEEAANLTVVEDWKPRFRVIQCPVLMLHASEILPNLAPMMSEDGAAETRELLPQSLYKKVPGNHVSMLFGKNAEAIVEAIEDFLTLE